MKLVTAEPDFESAIADGRLKLITTVDKIVKLKGCGNYMFATISRCERMESGDVLHFVEFNAENAGDAKRKEAYTQDPLGPYHAFVEDKIAPMLRKLLAS